MCEGAWPALNLVTALPVDAKLTKAAPVIGAQFAVKKATSIWVQTMNLKSRILRLIHHSSPVLNGFACSEISEAR